VARKVGKIIKEYITESSSENHPKKYKNKERIEFFFLYSRKMRHPKVTDNKPNTVHESIPCWAYLEAKK
jgi:hypothetical protein